MIERRETVVDARPQDIGLRLRRFLEDRGYDVAPEDSGLSARPRGRRARFGPRSRVPDRVVCGWAASESGVQDAPRSILCVSLHRDGRWLSNGILVRLSLEALAEALIAASESRTLPGPEARLRPLRNLITGTLALNVVLAFLLMFFLGTVLGLSPIHRLLAASAVALLDVLAISGFASLVIQGTREFMGR